MATKVNRVQLLCIFDAFLMGEAWSSLHYEMGSLGKDLCHRRTPTGSVFFFCKIRQWFRLNFWASRFYKSKDTKLYEFSSVKIA